MRLTFFVIFLFVIGFLNSCKEGCKDRHAINYDSRVKTENGTCLYCDSSHATDGAVVPINDSAAPYSDKHVMDFVLSEEEFSNVGNDCKALNRATGTSCKISLDIVNRTAGNINVNFNLFFQSNVTNTFWQDFGDIQVGPHQTLNFGLVDTTCSDFSTGNASVNFNANYF
ncbi:MAG: hypothetical protein JWO06_1256 [Bacteroidota bacterium]|nr:hypothetical protein [Bacteroidota bacterium]